MHNVPFPFQLSLFFHFQSNESWRSISSTDASPLKHSPIKKTNKSAENINDIYTKYKTPDKDEKNNQLSIDFELTPKEKLDLTERLNADDKYLAACRNLEELTNGLINKATDVCGNFRLNGNSDKTATKPAIHQKFKLIKPVNVTVDQKSPEQINKKSDIIVREEETNNVPKLKTFSLYDDLTFNNDTILGDVKTKPDTKHPAKFKLKVPKSNSGSQSSGEKTETVINLEIQTGASVNSPKLNLSSVVQNNSDQIIDKSPEIKTKRIFESKKMLKKCTKEDLAESNSDDDFLPSSSKKSNRIECSPISSILSESNNEPLNRVPSKMSKFVLKKSRKSIAEQEVGRTPNSVHTPISFTTNTVRNTSTPTAADLIKADFLVDDYDSDEQLAKPINDETKSLKTKCMPNEIEDEDSFDLLTRNCIKISSTSKKFQVTKPKACISTINIVDEHKIDKMTVAKEVESKNPITPVEIPLPDSNVQVGFVGLTPFMNSISKAIGTKAYNPVIKLL